MNAMVTDQFDRIYYCQLGGQLRRSLSVTCPRCPTFDFMRLLCNNQRRNLPVSVTSGAFVGHTEIPTGRPMISFRAIKLYLGIILGTVVLVTFLTAVGNDFVDWDDYAFVTTNYHIRSISTDSLRWMLTTFYQGAWHPLTWFSHALDRSLWGLNPAPHRLINIILHTLNVLLFCGLCMRLQDAWVERNPQRETISPESRFVAAWTAALLFGIHPLRVESVAWIAERKDVLERVLLFDDHYHIPGICFWRLRGRG